VLSLTTDNNYSRHLRGHKATPSVWRGPWSGGLPFVGCSPVICKVRRCVAGWKTLTCMAQTSSPQADRAVVRLCLSPLANSNPSWHDRRLQGTIRHVDRKAGSAVYLSGDLENAMDDNTPRQAFTRFVKEGPVGGNTE